MEPGRLGDCKTSCATNADCAAGFVCSASHTCVADA